MPRVDRTVPGRRGKRPEAVQEGHVYVANCDDGPMRHARPGAVIRVEGRGPPWIVVDRDPSSVIPGRWPGRLWRVRIVEAASALDQAAHGGPPLSSARYVRAICIEVIGEEDPAALFGPHGQAVLEVLRVTAALTRAQAGQLASRRHPDAVDANNRAWRSWMHRFGMPGDDYGDVSDTLMMGGPADGSPINWGFSLAYHLLFDRARELDGDLATGQDDEEGAYLLEPWSEAFGAIADAAFALGAPELVPKEDRAILLEAWSGLFGHSGTRASPLVP